MSILGGVKSGERETDAYERSRNTFKDEIVNEVEKMSKIMRTNLLKLRKESKRIEFMTVTGQMRALNDIKVKDMKNSEELLAGNVVEAEDQERRNLMTSQEEDAGSKLKIQFIKAEMKKIITMIKELHVQGSMAKTASQTYARVQGLTQEKRESMTRTAGQLADRERKERLALEASHVRLANNLKEWQRLELQGYDEAEQERVRRVNKIRASQLKEVQQRETEQLKEVQRLKAQNLVHMNDLDLEHLMQVEAMKADHLVRLDEADIVSRTSRRQLKIEIKKLRNEVRAASLKENFARTAEELRNSQFARAEKTRLAAEKKRSDTAAALENEVQLKLEDLEAGLEMMGEYLSSDSERTGSSRSRSTGKSSSKEAPSSYGGDDARGEDNANEDGKASAGKDLSDEMASGTQKAVDRSKKDSYDHSEALTRAEERLVTAQQEAKEKRAKEVDLQREEIEAAVIEYEEKRKKLIAANEQKLFALMAQHSEEKGEVTKRFERDMQSHLSAMLIEKEFENTRSKAEEFSRQQGASMKELFSSLKVMTADMAKSLPKDSDLAKKVQSAIEEMSSETSDMGKTVENVLEYTHLVQTGSIGKLALDIKFPVLFKEATTMLKNIVKDAGRSCVIKQNASENIQQTIKVNVVDLHSVLSKMLVYMMSISTAKEMVFQASQEEKQIQFSIIDKSNERDLVEMKGLEKALKTTNLSFTSDRRNLFGIFVAQMVLRNMDGMLSMSMNAAAGAGLTLTATVPATKEQ